MCEVNNLNFLTYLYNFKWHILIFYRKICTLLIIKCNDNGYHICDVKQVLNSYKLTLVQNKNTQVKEIILFIII